MPELLAQHELEPSLKTILVEGPSDAGFIRWYLQEPGYPPASVLAIDLIDVPAAIVAGYRFENGCAGRVHAAAKWLEGHVGEGQVVAITDADLDYALNRAPVSALHLRTDYTSLDLYTFDVQTLAKLLALNFFDLDIDASRLLQQLEPTLKFQFAVRLANATLALGLESVDWTKTLAADGGQIVQDQSRLIARYLQKNGQTSRSDEFWREVRRWESVKQAEPRRMIHGHDFTQLLAWYLRQLKPGRAPASEHLAGLLRSAVDRRRLATEPMFQELDRRILL